MTPEKFATLEVGDTIRDAADIDDMVIARREEGPPLTFWDAEGHRGASAPERWALVRPVDPVWSDERAQWMCRLGHVMQNTETGTLWRVISVRQGLGSRSYDLEDFEGERQQVSMWSLTLWRFVTYVPEGGRMPARAPDPELERLLDEEEAIAQTAEYVPTEEHKADVARLERWLIEEATRRDWCPDFERCLRDVNPDLHVKLGGRKLREGVAEITFRLRWTGDNETQNPMNQVDEAEIIQALRAHGLRLDAQFDSSRHAHFRVSNLRVNQVRQVP